MQNSATSLVRVLGVVCVGALLTIAAPRQAAAGTIVHFDTNMGDFDVELFDSAAPVTVANFLNNLLDGFYSNTMVHRSVSNFVIQGGGYSAADASLIPNNGTIPLEYSLPNERGTLAMARTAAENSGNSQWFINTVDNTTTLGPRADNPNTITNEFSAGYAVFGRVLGDGMNVVDAIAALPKFPYNTPFSELPLINYTMTQYNTGVDPFPHLVVVNNISIVPEPATLALAAIGAVSLIVFNRKTPRYRRQIH
jgi:cyclophilin family peptidyl-prolyl cis-trans isomerase